MKLRRIQSMEFPGVTPSVVSGRKPELRWVDPRSLLVDETYQRELSRSSMALIKKLIAGFSWNRMKPPIVVAVEQGLHVVDGQHTAIAAASVGLPQIPIFVVEAESQAERARSFVAHNTDRITVSSIAIHRALLASKDDDAVDVDAVCRRAGVRIRAFNQGSVVAEGDTMVVGGIYGLIKRRGVRQARVVLESLVKAKRAPIGSAELMAAERILCGERKDIDPAKLAMAIRIEGDKGIGLARAKSSRDRTPFWREVMARYLAQLDGKKSAHDHR